MFSSNNKYPDYAGKISSTGYMKCLDLVDSLKQEYSQVNNWNCVKLTAAAHHHLKQLPFRKTGNTIPSLEKILNKGGDCEDLSFALGAYIRGIQKTRTYTAIVESPDGENSHVYLEVDAFMRSKKEIVDILENFYKEIGCKFGEYIFSNKDYSKLMIVDAVQGDWIGDYKVYEKTMNRSKAYIENSVWRKKVK